MRYERLTLLYLLTAVFFGTAVGQPPKLKVEKTGDPFLADTTPMRWRSPEDVLRGLRSPDDAVRLEALSLLGVTDAQARTTVWAQTSPSNVIGTRVVTPDQVELRYAALDGSETQQAIVSAEVSSGATFYVAVATPVRGGWERVAAVSCWCKYDLAGDSLGTFAQLQPAADGPSAAAARFELVLHQSGGGTGIYTQIESHLRMRGGKLVRVAAYVSRSVSCDPGSGVPITCRIERRWLNASEVNGAPGSVLVEGRGSYVVDRQRPVMWEARDFEVRKLQQFTCTGFQWNGDGFRYEQLKIAPDPCAVKQ